jgi:hypothetical protein
MAHDRADWHYGGNFPVGLPKEAGGTHIGMYLAWAITRGLEGEVHRGESVDSLEAVRSHRMTGREFLFSECDEKLWEEDLNDIANEFTSAYYQTKDGASYFDDYAETLALDVPSVYHVADSWENFERIAQVLDRRFAEWKAARESPLDSR